MYECVKGAEKRGRGGERGRWRERERERDFSKIVRDWCECNTERFERGKEKRERFLNAEREKGREREKESVVRWRR